jgi:hypothetical protein
MSTSAIWSLEYLTGRWHPTIGDPTIIGWFTVGAYLACAALAFWTAWPHSRHDRQPFFFWIGVGLLMILLAINKQLDLHTLLTELGRQIARYQGWMDQRRMVQFWFIAGFSTLAAVVFVGAVLFMRNRLRRFMLAFIGLFFLLSFIIIRAASFHHIDQILSTRILHLRMNWILELSGIFSVMAAAGIDRWRRQKAPTAHGLPGASAGP